MSKYFRKEYFFLLLIFVLALFLRLWHLDKVPPSLFGDEVDTGYQAYSILKTGRDYFGNLFPIHFQSFGDWRVPLYIYLDVPFVAALGLNQWGVRLPAVIIGTLAVLATYLLAYQITKSKKIAIISSFLLAISPWHLQFSRGAFEAILITLLFPLGIVLFIKALKEKKALFIALSALSFGLAPYSYNTPKLFLPLLVVVLLVLFKKDFLVQKKQFFIFIFILVLVSLPLARDILLGQGGARFVNISIFSNSQISENVRIARQECDLSGFGERILHNKVNFWLKEFTNNYLQAYSLDFLFISGDPNPRHSIGNRGELYLFELPFLLIGLGILIYGALKKNRLYWIVFFWLVLAPIPAALTQDGGRHAIRLVLLLPFLQIVIALGIFSFFEWLKKKKEKLAIGLFLGFLVSLSVSLYLHQYFVHYPKTPGQWWNYGYQEAFGYVNSHEKNYDKIYITSSWEPSVVYTLFFSQYPPSLTQKEISISPVNIGKYYFLSPDINRIKREGAEPKTLYVLNPGEMENLGLKIEEQPNLLKIKDIFAPDGSRVRVIFTGR